MQNQSTKQQLKSDTRLRSKISDIWTVKTQNYGRQKSYYKLLIYPPMMDEEPFNPKVGAC